MPLLQLLGERLELGLATRDQHQVVALSGQDVREFSADTGRGSRDDGERTSCHRDHLRRRSYASATYADRVSDPRRQVPRTDAVLADPRLVAAVERLGRDAVKSAVVAAQDAARRGEISSDAVADLAVAGLPQRVTSLRPVLNATGIVVHTNLGRAPLSSAAVEALTVAAGYVDGEDDVDAGARGRGGRAAPASLAGAARAGEAVHVVNNGASALVLAATALASGRDI